MMEQSLQSNKKQSYQIFNQIAGTYDLLNRLLSFGIDIYWRKQLLKVITPRKEIKALDLATGTGDLAITLSSHKDITAITGLDMSEEMLKLGEKKIKQKGLDQKINMVQGDGQNLPFGDNSYDLITISFGIRNFFDVDKSLKECLRVLNEKGRMVVLEFSLPRNFIVKTVYLFYFRHLLPFIGNLLSRHKDAYSYLNKTVEDFPYGKEFEQKLIDAGFKNTGMRPLTFGIATLYWAERE